MDIYRSLASPLEKNSLAHYELAYSRRSGQWIVDSGQWREMGNGGKQTWKRVRGRKQEDLLPSFPNPAPSPFFLAHFSLRFPNYLKACYRLNTCIPSFPTFYGIYSTWASSNFGTLLLINRTGSTNFSTAFRRRNFYFFFVIFYRIFRFSPQSHSLFPPHPTICHCYDLSYALNKAPQGT